MNTGRGGSPLRVHVFEEEQRFRGKEYVADKKKNTPTLFPKVIMTEWNNVVCYTP